METAILPVSLMRSSISVPLGPLTDLALKFHLRHGLIYF